MNVHEIRRYQMLARVREFAMTYRQLFAAAGAAPKLVVAVDTAVDAAEQCAAVETSRRAAARQRTRSKAAARERLRCQLAAIRRTARALAQDDVVMDAEFRVPKDARDFELTATARAIASAAAAFEHEFTAYALPATFIADLHAAIDAFEAATAQQHAARGEHVGARVGIEAAVAEGFQAVLRLDAIVANCLASDSAAVGAWRVVRRVERSPRHNAITIVRREAAA